MLSSLEQAPVGQSVQIQSIPNAEDMLTLLRLGLSQGSFCKILSKVPGGPLVIQQGLAEMALGRELSQRIFVESVIC